MAKLKTDLKKASNALVDTGLARDELLSRAELGAPSPNLRPAPQLSLSMLNQRLIAACSPQVAPGCGAHARACLPVVRLGMRIASAVIRAPPTSECRLLLGQGTHPVAPPHRPASGTS